MKRLLYVDHSFHVRTRSTQALISLLESHFHVDIFWDERWKGGPGITRVRLNQEDYDAVVFFQELPPFELDRIRCKNIVYVPMYDGISLSDKSFWRSLADVKILSFCKVVDDLLATEELRHLYLKYFPEPVPADRSERFERGLFFWQRSEQIGWSTVRKLIGDNPIAPVHLHGAPDPGSTFQPPDPTDIESFHMSFSTWFDSPQHYLRVMAQYPYFVAPRLKEGIGMSFLEAMAVGRVVIAADNPTMNEYITHGVTGYLFDPANPGQLELRNAERIGLNAQEAISVGREAWNREKYRILEFVDAPPPRLNGRVRHKRIRRRGVWELGVRVPRKLKNYLQRIVRGKKASGC